MTKKLFLTAASVAALAFAGAASAADLSVSLATVDVTPVSGPYLIADVATGTLQGTVEAEATYTNEIPLANNLLITLRLGGGATFATAVGIADIDLQDTLGDPIANQQKTVSDGGQAGDNFVTYLVSTPSDAIKSVEFSDVDIEFAAGATPTLAIETQTEFGTKIEGGSAKFGAANAATLVGYDSLVAVAVTPNVAGNAVVTLDANPIFSTFAVGGAATTATSAKLGDIAVTLNDVYLPAGTVDPTVFALTTAKVDLNAVDDLEIEYEGNFGGATGVAIAPIGDVAANGAAQVVYTSPVTATLSGINSKLASEYKARVTVNFDDYAAYVTPFLSLSSIVRDGVSAEIPWIASSALAAKNQTVSVIRVANKSIQSANVYVEHVTTAPAQGLTPATIVGSGVPVLAGTVSAQSDLQIGTAALTDLLGEFVRGNVVVTVEAKENDITVSNRISYADGKVEETTVLKR